MNPLDERTSDAILELDGKDIDSIAASPNRRQLLRGALAAGGLMIGLGAVELGTEAPAVAAPAKPTIAGDTTWGAKPARGALTRLNHRPTYLVIHHTASANSTDYSKAHAYALARSIQQTHFSEGWSDSGQQFTVSRGGYVMEGRHGSLNALNNGSYFIEGAQVLNHNTTTIGIENEGTYTTATIRPAHYTALVHLAAYACYKYKIPVAKIKGHRDFMSTACPGNKLYAKLPQLRKDVAAKL